MKNLKIELPLKVKKSFINYFDRLPEKSYEDNEPLIQSRNDNAAETQEKSYPLFTLNTKALHDKKLEVKGGSWLLSDQEKHIFSEFDEDGELVKFYPTNETTKEMMAIFDASDISSKKIKAVLTITALNLNFCWFGDTIPQSGLTDTFALFGYSIPGFEKGITYNLSTFLDLSLSELKKYESATPSTLE